MCTLRARYFTWPGDREHGLTRLQAKRALLALQRRGLVQHNETHGWWRST